MFGLFLNGVFRSELTPALRKKTPHGNLDDVLIITYPSLQSSVMIKVTETKNS